jgi:hypothetical protein
MKTFRLILAFLVLAGHRLPAQTDVAPLPALETVLQRATERALREDDNDVEFSRHYHYTRVRLTEYRNARGDLKKHEEKRSDEGTTPGAAPVVPAPVVAKPKPTEPAGPVSDTHSNIRGKALVVRDYSLPDLLGRFQFTLAGRETVNGRPSLVVDFRPADKRVPVRNFKDHFINKAAGRVWVDEADYALARAELRLTRRVNVVGGLVGAVWKFTYSFDRERTPEGLWFARHVDWHLEGREVFINRIVDYHEQKTGARKVL